MKKSIFASEVDLCSAFIAALPKGWTAYPETAGFDILLVRDDDGFQVGVEAKLRLNAVVLAQIAESKYRDDGPDCRAVLIPEGSGGSFVAITNRLALTVLTVADPESSRHYRGSHFSPPLPSEDGPMRYRNEEWIELCPLRRCPLPSYVPDVAAGRPAPVSLTEWKIKAIKIAILLSHRGYVTRADFRALRIDIRRWIDGRWIVASEQGFVAGTIPDFARQHPSVYEQIKADLPTWLPKVETAAQLVLRGAA